MTEGKSRIRSSDIISLVMPYKEDVITEIRDLHATMASKFQKVLKLSFGFRWKVVKYDFDIIWRSVFFSPPQGEYHDLNNRLVGNRAELYLLKPYGPFELSLLVSDVMKRVAECLRTKEIIYILNEG